MRAGLFLSLLPLLLLAGCHKAPAPPPSPPDRTAQLLEQRKDALVGQLADCESGTGESGRSRYVGRFQFEPRTVMAFVRQRDGRSLSTSEAVALASDYEQAAALVKYVLFERDGASHWPACSRKLGLAQQVADIKAGG